MSDKKEPTFEERVTDPIGTAIGSFGIWHFWMCLFIFSTKFPVGWHQLATIFLAPPVDFECVDPDNQTDKCSDDCKKVEYNRTVFDETIITEWDLVCDKRYLGSLVQTIFMFGILVGSMSFGIWSDKLGRRPPLVYSLLLQLLVGVLQAMVPWFVVFCILRFLLGVATGGSMVTGFVLLMEITVIKNREVMGILYQIPANLGHALLPVFSYFLRDWRKFQFGISIMSAMYLPYYWVLPESPRWLMAAGRVDDSAKILERAAKMNKRPTDQIRAAVEEAAKRMKAKELKKGVLSDLFRYPNLRCKTICISFNWFVCGLGYFGVNQYVGELGGDIFLNVLISGCLSIPGAIVAVFTCRFLGRKPSLIISNTLCGICMLIIAGLPSDKEFAKVILASIGVFGMSMTFAVVYVFSGELFPTVVRNVGMGFASVIARFGSMAAPFVPHTKSISENTPPIIFGVVPIIGACLILFLPETLGAHLPETIQDGENFGKKTNAE